ncbi:MAG: hypothetical protein ACK5LY_08775 [Lachnospirales bacterium]
MNNIIINTLKVVPSIALTTSILVIFIAIINYRFKQTSKNAKDMLDEFVENELEANTSKAYPIDLSYFRNPNISFLPIETEETLTKKYDEVKRYLISSNQRRILKASKYHMIRAGKKLTNIEIKQLFGANQLDSFSLYEQNMTNYTTGLKALALVYIDLKDYEKAKAFLDECIAMGSTSSTTYTLLARLLYETKDKYALMELSSEVNDATFLKHNEVGKEKIITYLKTLKF